MTSDSPQLGGRKAVNGNEPCLGDGHYPRCKCGVYHVNTSTGMCFQCMLKSVRELCSLPLVNLLAPHRPMTETEQKLLRLWCWHGGDLEALYERARKESIYTPFTLTMVLEKQWLRVRYFDMPLERLMYHIPKLFTWDYEQALLDGYECHRKHDKQWEPVLP